MVTIGGRAGGRAIEPLAPARSAAGRCGWSGGELACRTTTCTFPEAPKAPRQGRFAFDYGWPTTEPHPVQSPVSKPS
jgi:hypothetical protein